MAAIFDPGLTGRHAQLLARARKTNRDRDRSEREAGFASPDSGDLASWLRTIAQALAAGIAQEDWNAVAEGLAMLQDAELSVRHDHENR